LVQFYQAAGYACRETGDKLIWGEFDYPTSTYWLCERSQPRAHIAIAIHPFQNDTPPLAIQVLVYIFWEPLL
jgi:hypothetical protein